MEVVSIDEFEGQYEAVSYTWGSKSTGRHVIVNGKTLRLRDNIWHCLKHLRDHNLTRSRLWVDSICINQDDELGKGQQVAKMGQIFRAASKVLIWLGATSEQTYLVTPGTDDLQDSIGNLPSKDLDAWIDILGHSDPRSLSLENQIMSIIYNPYWERLWIIQEIALSRNASIVFGKTLLDKDCFSVMYLAAREYSKPGYRSWIARQRDVNIRNSGTAMLDHHPITHTRGNNGDVDESNVKCSLTELIQAYQWQFCTDPRDYVYGLMGLLDSSSPFEIDYRSSNEDVAIAALQCLEKEGSEKASFHLGLNMTAAAALLKALTVTSQTYLAFEAGIPPARAETMSMKRFDILFKPMLIFTAAHQVWQSENKPYEDRVQPNGPGSVVEDLYLMDCSDLFQVKLLSGQLKQFVHVRDYNQLEPKSGVSLWCSLHTIPAIIIQRPPNDDCTINIEHLVWPDLARPHDEPGMWIEKPLPSRVKDALEREINAYRIDWNNLDSSMASESFLHLSISEIIAVCELIAPKASDRTEFWQNGCS